MLSTFNIFLIKIIYDKNNISTIKEIMIPIGDAIKGLKKLGLINKIEITIMIGIDTKIR